MTAPESGFDSVHDCQKVFRELLHAISHPGDECTIAEYAHKTDSDLGSFIAIAQTLLDSKNTFAIFGEGMQAETLVGHTRAIESGKEPKFIFVVSEISDEDRNACFAMSSAGTIVEPHNNTVLFVFVREFDRECRLSGPGIEGSKAAMLSGYALAWLRKRDRMEFEYPSGIDIFFVSAMGAVIAIPRKVRVEE